jgi:hypothetical protein
MSGAVVGPELITLIFMLGLLGGWGLKIAGLVQTVKACEGDFRRIGRTRGGQPALYIVGIVDYPMGAVVGWNWLFSAKKRLDALSPLPAAPVNVQPAPGWWLASDGRWYPPQGEQLPPPPPPSSSN